MSSLPINTIKQETETMEQAGKIVRSLRIANQLLDFGNKIIHIKIDKQDPDEKRSVYVFELNEKFEKDMDEIMQQRRRERNDYIEERIEREVEERLQRRLAEMSEE